MAASQIYMPAGQTSMVKKGSIAVQVQTEYSFRPYPRIKTTIFNDGQVVHKVEKKLDSSIDSVDEQMRVERIIRNQHKDVMAVVQERAQSSTPALKKKLAETPDELSGVDKIAAIPGVLTVYCLDSDGSFHNRKGTERFRKIYATLLKDLDALLSIFAMRPGQPGLREKGVYEVERDGLYLASAGDKFYFITVRRDNDTINYEKAIKEIVKPFGEF